MIIDIHTHCFPDSLAPRAVGLLAQKAGITAHTDGTINELKISMRDAGIDISVLQPIATRPDHTTIVNRWALEVQDKNIISFGTIHPEFPDWKEEVKWLAGSDIRGVKFHPDYQDFYVDDPRIYPLYEAVFKAGLAVLFHAGIDIGIPEPCHCTPSRLRNVLDAFPGAVIVAAHMGGFKYWDEVKKYLIGREIYLDTSYSFNVLGPEAMKTMIKGHGANKILFGSDSPWTKQSSEIDNIKSLGLSDEETSGILGNNAMSILRQLP